MILARFVDRSNQGHRLDHDGHCAQLASPRRKGVENAIETEPDLMLDRGACVRSKVFGQSLTIVLEFGDAIELDPGYVQVAALKSHVPAIPLPLHRV